MPRPKSIPRQVWLLFPAAILVLSLVHRGSAPAQVPADASRVSPRSHVDAAIPAATTPIHDDAGVTTPAPARPVTPTATAQPEVVDVGAYVHHIPEIDLRTNTYLLDFYLWFRWSGALDPTRTFEFTNAVESWNQLRAPIYTAEDGTARPDTLPDGSRYQIYHVQGRFQHPFSLRDYPFDQQDITLELEDSQSVESALVYRVDTVPTGYHDRVSLPGWRVLRAGARVTSEHYRTNFGDLRLSNAGDRYTHFAFSLHLDRPVGGYLAKVLIPIGIVLLISFIVFFIHPRYFETRVTIALTNLISAVALQLNSGSDLPNVGYLVLLDRIYHLCYMMIFLCLAESVFVARLHDDGREVRARRIDRACVLVCPVLFALGLAYLIARR